MKVMDDDGGRGGGGGDGGNDDNNHGRVIDNCTSGSRTVDESETGDIINKNNRFMSIFGFIIRKFTFLIREFRNKMLQYFQKMTRVCYNICIN
jgi:hypothetical protein